MKVDFNPFAGAKMPDMKPAGGKKPRMGRTAAIVAAVAAVAVLGFNSVYSINEQENAVVTTLGSPQAVTTPGLHLSLIHISEPTRP